MMNCPADQMVAIQTYTGTLEVLTLLAAAVFRELGQAKLKLSQRQRFYLPGFLSASPQ